MNTYIENEKGLRYKGEATEEQLIELEQHLNTKITNPILREYLLTTSYIIKNNNNVHNKEKLAGLTPINNDYGIYKTTMKLRYLLISLNIENPNIYICLMLPEFNNKYMYIFTDQTYIYTIRKKKLINLHYPLDLFLYKFIIENKTLNVIIKKYM